YVPITAYEPAGDRATYDAAYTHWNGVPARDSYRVAWRAMAANTGERTLISALIPPGAAHPNGVFDVGLEASDDLVMVLASMSSLLGDFLVRVAPKSGIYKAVVERLAYVDADPRMAAELRLRILRLNCVSQAYGRIWTESWGDEFTDLSWADDMTASRLGEVAPVWDESTPLRGDHERRQAQLEVDVLVSLALGISPDELCTVYRTQFAVLRGYDQRDYLYDANGRLVPMPVQQVWRRKGDAISKDERTHTNAMGNTYVYELPFRNYDREADMRRAYAVFAERLGMT
ncbi:MAG TPA: hypothetical protein VIP98_01180, partial [Microlunatus sp.]